MSEISPPLDSSDVETLAHATSKAYLTGDGERVDAWLGAAEETIVHSREEASVVPEATDIDDDDDELPSDEFSMTFKDGLKTNKYYFLL